MFVIESVETVLLPVLVTGTGVHWVDMAAPSYHSNQVNICITCALPVWPCGGRSLYQMCGRGIWDEQADRLISFRELRKRQAKLAA